MASFATTEQLRTYLPQVTETVDNDALLEDCLTRATGIVRDALRAMLADPTFDYAAWGVASTKIVRGYGGAYLELPAHQAGSVTLVEYQGGINPATYTASPAEWQEESGQLYRPYGWDVSCAGIPRYRITAIWGYGPDVPAAIEELTLELAVNIYRTRDNGGFVDMAGVAGEGGTRQVAGLNRQQIMILENVRNQLIQVAV